MTPWYFGLTGGFWRWDIIKTEKSTFRPRQGVQNLQGTSNPRTPVENSMSNYDKFIKVILNRIIKLSINPGFAYLWRQTPLSAPTMGAPIYAENEFSLPAEPWIWVW